MADLRPEYVAWRDEHFLATIARMMNDRPTSRAEAEDIHRALGEILGFDKRGGARTKEQWNPCSIEKRAGCETCQVWPGHGPYLYRKAGSRWVKVREPPDVAEAREARGRREHRNAQTRHALALLEAAVGEAEGMLQGAEADEARRRVRDAIHN